MAMFDSVLGLRPEPTGSILPPGRGYEFKGTLCTPCESQETCAGCMWGGRKAALLF